MLRQSSHEGARMLPVYPGISSLLLAGQPVVPLLEANGRDS